VMASNFTYEVGVYDLYETDVAAGIRTNTKQLIAKGALTEEELASRLSRISFTTDLDSELVRRADLLIEAVFEDMKTAGYLRQAGGALPSRHHLLHQLFRYEPQ
ncbi:MAG: 3-hydroxyacyl-CoA dehydrogenase NAD-binding domain-containing protein, partial [Intestinimonas sp.]